MPVRATPNHKMKAPSYPFYDWASLYDWINKPWKLHDDVWKSCKFLNSFAVHSRSTLQFILTSFWLIVKIFSAFIFQQTMSLNDFPASSGFSLAWLLAFTKSFAWLVFRVVSWFTPWGGSPLRNITGHLSGSVGSIRQSMLITRSSRCAPWGICGRGGGVDKLGT